MRATIKPGRLIDAGRQMSLRLVRRLKLQRSFEVSKTPEVLSGMIPPALTNRNHWESDPERMPPTSTRASIGAMQRAPTGTKT